MLVLMIMAAAFTVLIVIMVMMLVLMIMAAAFTVLIVIMVMVMMLVVGVLQSFQLSS